MLYRLFFFVLSFLIALALTGCCATAPNDAAQQPAYTPTYAELVRRHNERIKGIEKFWARAVIELRWVDSKGGNRFEQGDGSLVLDLPLKSSLTLGKLGQTKLWAGSNDTYFWLFDQLEGTKLYLGRQDGKPLDVASDHSQRSSPLPVRPVDIPALLGILPIPEPREGEPVPQVKWQNTSFIIEPPGTGARYHYHPIHYQVLGVALLDDRGRPLLVSELKWPQRIEKTGALIGPYINTRVAVTTPGEPGGMTLFLTEMTDDPQRVNPKVFDLDFLRNMMKADTVIAIEPR
ncbi:MAG: hypothetical protein WD768_12590 [Phycisphaeraceae bacterium]